MTNQSLSERLRELLPRISAHVTDRAAISNAADALDEANDEIERQRNPPTWMTRYSDTINERDELREVLREITEALDDKNHIYAEALCLRAREVLT